MTIISSGYHVDYSMQDFRIVKIHYYLQFCKN